MEQGLELLVGDDFTLTCFANKTVKNCGPDHDIDCSKKVRWSITWEKEDKLFRNNLPELYVLFLLFH